MPKKEKDIEKRISDLEIQVADNREALFQPLRKLTPKERRRLVKSIKIMVVAQVDAYLNGRLK